MESNVISLKGNSFCQLKSVNVLFTFYSNEAEFVNFIALIIIEDFCSTAVSCFALDSDQELKPKVRKKKIFFSKTYSYNE